MTRKPDFIDDKFEILEIRTMCGVKPVIHWQNPDIATHCNFNPDGYDNDVHRVWLSLDDEDQREIHLVVKSECLDRYWSGFYLDDNDNFVNRKPEELDKVLGYLFNIIPVMLFEDCWCPGGEQFCCTDTYEQLTEVTGGCFHCIKKIHFSPDIAMWIRDCEFGWDT